MFSAVDPQGKKSDLPLHSKTTERSHFRPAAYPRLRSPRRHIILFTICGVFLLYALYAIFSSSATPNPVPQLETIINSPKSQATDTPLDTLNQIPKLSPELDANGVTFADGSPVPKSPEVLELEESYRSSVSYYDLNDFSGNAHGRPARENGEIVLMLVPLRNAQKVLPLMFRHLMNLTYPHELIDLAFLVSDCTGNDHTLEHLYEYSVYLQNGTLADVIEDEEKLIWDIMSQTKISDNSDIIRANRDIYMNYMDTERYKQLQDEREKRHDEYRKPFRSVTIYEKDFGQVIGQGFSDRHGVKVQGVRRKLMGRARNWLVANAVKAYHSWVYWRDADIEICPGTVLEDLMKHNQDVIVPNVWRPLPNFLGKEQPYDLNSWQESQAALELAQQLDEDEVIVEGYVEYPTWRVHLAYIREEGGNPDTIIPLDGIGGVSILAKAKVFRQGANFPAFTFDNHAETEAFGKMCRKMGFSVSGLPHYVVWHIFEPSEDDLVEITKLERQKRRARAAKAADPDREENIWF